jgi:hypothetical protein
MNIITHLHAYCLYPRNTLLRSTTIPICSSLSSLQYARRADCFAKYARRGYALRNPITSGDLSDPSSDTCFGPRSLGDRYTFTYRLTTPRLLSQGDMIRFGVTEAWSNGILDTSVLNSFIIAGVVHNQLKLTCQTLRPVIGRPGCLQYYTVLNRLECRKLLEEVNRRVPVNLRSRIRYGRRCTIVDILDLQAVE